MITEQIITYIKDQIARGMSREKIRSNLLSAGWIEDDIKQAFSFADPNGENASLKIAPAFAVVDPVAKEISVDKTELIKDDKPFIPILKKDEVSSNYTPAHPADEPVSVMKHIEPAVTKPAEPSILAQPASVAPKSILVTRKAQPLANTFGDEGEIKKPKSSTVLKSITIMLVIILIIGNVFLWVFVMPKIDKQNQDQALILEEQKKLENSVAQNGRESNQNPPVNNNQENITNPVEAFRAPTTLLKDSATAYFSKYNTYGSVAMSLGSCGASSTLFVDENIKLALTQMTGISKNIPQCSLGTDDTVKKNRMTQYLVYIPMGATGYCIDSTGAILMVNKKPTTTSCLSGL